MSQRLTKKQLIKKLNYHKGMAKKYEMLVRKHETPTETVSREVASWPAWKRNVRIGTIGMTKKELKEHNDAQEMYRQDSKRYSYWPE